MKNSYYFVAQYLGLVKCQFLGLFPKRKKNIIDSTVVDVNVLFNRSYCYDQSYENGLANAAITFDEPIPLIPRWHEWNFISNDMIIFVLI